MKKTNETNHGITLMALVITIIVLIILASISINMISGNNSLIKNAGNAKESSEIAEEKEKIEMSAVQAIGKNKYGNLVQGELQTKLDEYFNGKATAMEGANSIIVLMEDSDRVYILDIDGNITTTETLQNDETAGDITKGGVCTGKSDEPYRITCIEDLVAFSRGINNKEFSTDCYVILEKTLDFKSILSYGNYKQTYSYDPEKNAYVEDDNSTTTLMQLCTTGQGFIPIEGPTWNYCFKGNFDGQTNEIQNIFINREGVAGLFGMTQTCTIQNLGITGDITSTESCAGGIVGTECNTSTVTIIKCHNSANVTAKGNARRYIWGSITKWGRKNKYI